MSSLESTIFDLLNLTETSQESLDNKFKHKWLKIGNDIIFAKHIYPNWMPNCDIFDWSFIGRTSKNEFIRCDIQNEPFLENIKNIEILEL